MSGGYQYCGPGTKLERRLARGDLGINGLDRACKVHDIAYSKFKDNTRRSESNRVPAGRTWERFKAEDASYGEKAATWAVATAMKVKAQYYEVVCRIRRKRKMSLNKSEKRSFKGNGIAEIKIKKEKKKKNSVKKKTTKKFGVLLIAMPTLLAGVSAIESLDGGVTRVAKTVFDMKAAQKHLAEHEHHTKEAHGKGLYLKPYKGGGVEQPKRKINTNLSKRNSFVLSDVPMRTLTNLELLE